MNKLQGFQALQRSGLPSVPWEPFVHGTKLSKEKLWTIRSAVREGDDLNLPRKVGVSAEEAETFAEELLKTLGQQDLVLYYPYFVAEKSGVIAISNDQSVIEAVQGDLWNLVTEGKKNVTILFEQHDIQFIGNEHFLNQEELLELAGICTKMKKRFLQHLSGGKTIFLEWSYGSEANRNGKPAGGFKLVFYEIRTVG